MINHKLIAVLFFICSFSLCNSSFAGKIEGRIVFSGTPPKPAPLTIDKDDYCKKSSKGKLSEKLIVSADKGIMNSVVYLKTVKGSFTPPEKPVVISQKKCIFTPHVTAILAGTPIDVKNEDPVNHNVRTNPEENSPINYAMPEPMTVPLPEMVYPEQIKMSCDIHKWMDSYIVILNNPYFSISGKNGSFVIENVPAGTYELRAWHEMLGVQTKQITLPASETLKQEFIFSIKK